MEKRRLGKTGFEVSLLGFGCGAVGGLMTNGDPADQERAVARALEMGINYFDTAAQYGNGRSETNLGRVIKSLKPDIYVGTKVRLPPTERGQIAAAIAAALEAEPVAAAAGAGRSVPVPQRHRRHDRGREFFSDRCARRGGAGVRPAAPAGQARLLRHHRGRRDGGAAQGRRCRRVRDGAGQLQFAKPQPRGRGAGGFPGAGLRRSARPRQSGGYGGHQYPRARRRRAVGQRGAARKRFAAARPDRLRQQLPGRSRTRPALRCRWCKRAMPTAWSRRRCAM